MTVSRRNDRASVRLRRTNPRGLEIRLKRKIVPAGDGYVVNITDTATGFSRELPYPDRARLEEFITRLDPDGATNLVAQLTGGEMAWSFPSIPAPFSDLATEIELNLHYELYFTALITTLAMFDMCAASEYENGKSTGERYTKWCDKWVTPRHSVLPSGALWLLRCGVIHQGRGSKGNPASQLVFTAMENVVAENNISTGGPAGVVSDIDNRTFCRAAIAATADWHQGTKTNPWIVRNVKHVLRYKDGWGSIHGIRCLAAADA